MWKYNDPIVLPVTFISISANRAGADILVKWNVGEEIGIRSYNIERSTDGRSFTTAGTVNTTINSLLEHSYSYVDANVTNVTTYYRIKSIGFSGEIKYSNIVKVVDGITTKSFVISPNPVAGTIINLQFKNQPQGRYTIKLLSTTGQVIFKSEIAHSGWNSNRMLNLSTNMVSGTYLVEIIAPDNTKTIQTLFVKK